MAKYGDGSRYNSGVKYIIHGQPIERIIMAKVKRDDKTLPVVNKCERGDEVVAASEGSALLKPETIAKVATWKTKNGNLRTAYQLQQAAAAEAQRLTAAANTVEGDWNLAAEAVFAGIETDTNGDPDKIRTLKCVPYEPGAKAGPVPVPQVTNLVVSPGDADGHLDWMCDPQKGGLYLVQTSPDVVPRVWSIQESSKKSSGSIPGLPSLTRVWVRVAIKGSHNTGEWSDPALGIVP